MRLTTRLALVSATAAVVGACATEPPRPAAAPAANAPAPATQAAAAPAPSIPPMPPLPMASAAMLATHCTGCHGEDGASLGPASPSIGGLDKDYFIKTMRAFKNGKRHATVMGRIAKGYTDDEIKAMAGYFASKKWVPQAQATDAARVAQGRILHQKHCDKCHEDTSRATDEGGTILAGQWMPYLLSQIEDYASGKTPTQSKKYETVRSLAPEEVDALLQFYASQK